MRGCERCMVLISVFLFLCAAAYADTYLNIQNNFGYTLVDVGQAMDIDELSPVTGQGLNDWNQFNYKILGQLLFDNGNTVSYGPEIGFHRLYYWEEKYRPLGSSQRWRSGTIWTFEAGVIMNVKLGHDYYFLTGLSIHNFLNDSGTTLGIPLALGHEIKATKNFSLPIEFRMDIIFGNAMPIGLGGGIGLKFDILSGKK
jgi:hypothetical protein